MNNLFVDVLENNKSFKTNIFDNILLKTFGYILKEDVILKNNFSATFFLLIDEKNFIEKKNNLKVLSANLKLKLLKNKKINVVFSKQVSKETDIKEKIKAVINGLNNELKYIETINNLKNLDMMYISDYISKSNIHLNKFKLLIAISSIKDFDNKKVIEYISKYKFVDILRLKEISKTSYKKLSNMINKINNEYGSSIEIIQKRNIQDYDALVIYSKNQKEYIKSHYILKNKAFVLDVTNVDEDVLSKEYKSYNKNKSYIETIFNRMRLNISNYFKSDIGSLYMKY